MGKIEEIKSMLENRGIVVLEHVKGEYFVAEIGDEELMVEEINGDIVATIAITPEPIDVADNVRDEDIEVRFGDLKNRIVTVGLRHMVLYKAMKEYIIKQKRVKVAFERLIQIRSWKTEDIVAFIKLSSLLLNLAS